MSTVKGAVLVYWATVPKLWNASIATHRAAVRDAILDATVALVRERGLRAVTMADIAARAGIGRATLYKYFGDADAILRAWHEREIDGHLAELISIKTGPGDAASRLAAVLERYATAAHTGRAGHDGELALFLHRDEKVVAARHRLRHVLADLVAEAAKAGQARQDIAAEELAAYCMSALSGAGELRSQAALRRLVALTMIALKP